MKQLPIFLDIKNSSCLVVGAGPVATRKTKMLCNAGADIVVVAPDCSKQMQQLLDTQKITHVQREYQSGDLADKKLVVAATNNNATNLSIANEAKTLNLLCNVADDPASGNFILPSVIDRNPLYVAISSGGASPILSRILKNRLDAFIPESYGELAALAGHYREQIKSRFKTIAERKRFWDNALGGNVAEMVLAGDAASARALIERQLANKETDNTHSQTDKTTGEVYLVGAGPGNPDLLTFRALRLMQQADVVLHDRLVAPSILEMCNPDAEKIYVGKKRADHAMPQGNINQTLINHALAGKRVLRLKGGDPFIFGRGGEEIESLAAHDIPFQVVPGITAASGCASYAGIPLTHRDHAQSCTFVTGHLKDGSIDLDWHSLAGSDQTIVCYMGLLGLPVICKQLIAHGKQPDTPAALIERGTTSNQQVHTGTISNLPELIAAKKVTAPTLIIIGTVVTLREKLDWLGTQ